MSKKKKKIKFSVLQTVMVFLLTLLLSFGLFYILATQTALKDYIIEPSRDFDPQKDVIINLHEDILSLKETVQKDSLYIAHLRKVVTGDIAATKLDTSLIANQSPLLIDESTLYASEKDSLFRKEIREEEIQEKLNPKVSDESTLLFPPIRGPITSRFDIADEHLAVDIAAKQGEAVVSSADGSVIFAGWTPDTGYVIIVQHDLEMLTVYKHNSKLYKKQGDNVQKGEAIAAVGNTGDFTTGPHVHFELWVQGKQVNPESYIDF